MYLSKRFAALPPDKKLRARLTLYGGLAGLLLTLALMVSYLARTSIQGRDQGWVETDFVDRPEVLMLQEYVRIDTSQTTGSELAGALYLAEQLEAAGLEPHIERFSDDRANLWAILEGQSPEALVLHNHIDVYPANNPEEWEFPPFAGVIDKAWLYGRGTFDMKSVTIAQLLAMIDLERSDHQPKRSVIFLATGSEEVGSHLGSQWILARHPELVERFSLVLTEGGVVEALSHEEVKFWGIEFAQKWFAEGWVCAASRHRLEELQQDLEQLSEANHDLRLTPEVETFLASYAASRAAESFQQALGDTREALYHPDRFDSLPTYLRSLFRSEIATFPIEEDPEGGYRMRLILHLLPHADFASERQKLLPDWIINGVSLALEPPAGAPFGSPKDHPALATIAELIQETYPSATVGPYFLVWSATDSRFFRAYDIPSYGFSPFLIFATDTFRRDTDNERIGLPGFLGGVELYRRVVQRLAN